MEIDITAFVHGEAEPFDFSRSAAEAGQNAGPDSWRNALEQAATAPMLNTGDQLQAMRDFVRSSGGWDAEEIAAMSDEHLNALFIQWVSGDMREAGMDECEPDDFDWDTYEWRAASGEISARIYQADIPGHPDFGKIFFTLGD